MRGIQTLQLYSITLILILFAWAIPMKVHGALVNRLIALCDKDELQEIMEEFLHQLIAQPYDKDRAFSSAEEDVDSYLSFVPRLQSYRYILVNICRNKRQAAGLKEEPKHT